MRKILSSLVFSLTFLMHASCQIVPPPITHAPSIVKSEPAVVVDVPVPANETHVEYVQRVYSAVTLLYSQDEEGGMHMHCTATAYRKYTTGYRFVTAAHCIHGDTDDEQSETKYFITSDSDGEKTYIPAQLVKASSKTSGEDFAIFSVSTEKKFSIVPLGDNSLISIGATVTDVASPLGLGKQLFQGYVSNVKLDRPKLDADVIKWSDVMLVMIGSAPGSSGSAIVSDDQKAIIGLLVGGFNGENIGAIVVPVNKFKAFEQQVDAGTYRKSPPPINFFQKLFGGA